MCGSAETTDNMTETNPNARLETFCDGVFAIALTLLIFDIRIPSTVLIHTDADFWLALKNITPSILAFVLSFIVILITWVNHHNTFKLVGKSSASFIYANGLMLLAVVFLPFPTALLGEYLFTDHAAPAVIIYDAVLAFQAVGWIAMVGAARKGHLSRNQSSAGKLRRNNLYGYFALMLYSLCALLAVWFPFDVAIFTIVTWIIWLVRGISLGHETD
jgi:uncharacterized membrane protein